MDTKLLEYLKKLREKYPYLTFPNFSHKYSWDINDKKILVLLKSPGNPGPMEIKECCVTNDDQTSFNQREIILGEMGIPPSEILFWNFYPFHDPYETPEGEEVPDDYGSSERWACELQNLARIMENLKVIVLSGQDIWDGMRYFDPIHCVPLISTPSPSNQALNNPTLREHYRDRWRRVRQIVYDCRC